MGSGISLQGNVDSPSMPGKRHVVSGPLTEYGDKGNVFDQLLQIAMDPVRPYEKYYRKGFECVEQEPGLLTVKVQRDGRKLKGLKLKEDSIDPPAESFLCRYSRERGTITSESSGAEGIKHTSCLLLLENPLRVEFWLEEGGTHHGDDSVAALLRYGWLDPLAHRLGKPAVRVWDNVDSPTGKGKSALSESLDKHFSFTGLFDALQEELKVPPDEYFIVTSRDLTPVGHEQKLSNGNASMTFIHKPEAADGMVCVQAKHGSMPLVNTWYALHQSPLRLESWLEYDEGRLRVGGYSAGRELQDLVNRLVGNLQSPCSLL